MNPVSSPSTGLYTAVDGLLTEGPPEMGWHGERGVLRLNHDGQVSRRAATPEQLAEAGLMSAGEIAAHRGLAPGREPGRVLRLAAVPSDDPWYAVDANGVALGISLR